ncbi:MAG: sulfotransferase [Verrucomicrobiota bacterium]
MNPDWHGPLFVVGCSRSGTTLLQQILNAHPRVAVAPETHFVPDYWLRAGEYGHLAREEDFQRLVGDIAASTYFPDLGLPAEEFRAAAGLAPRTFPAVFGLLMDLFARSKGADIVGEKTPLHVRHMLLLKEAFPPARFIHVVRDPRAVVNSRRRQPWAADGIRENAEFWRETMGAARRAGRSLGKDLITVRYEDLVGSLASTVAALCRDLGVAFEPGMLEYWKVNARLVNTQREPWKSAALEPPRTDRIDGWRRELRAEELGEIEAATWPVLCRYGYRPVTPLLRLLPRAAIGITRRSVSRWRKAARRKWRR